MHTHHKDKFILNGELQEFDQGFDVFLELEWTYYGFIPESTEPYEPEEPESVIITSAEIDGENVFPFLQLLFDLEKLEETLIGMSTDR